LGRVNDKNVAHKIEVYPEKKKLCRVVSQINTTEKDVGEWQKQCDREHRKWEENLEPQASVTLALATVLAFLLTLVLVPVVLLSTVLAVVLLSALLVVIVVLLTTLLTVVLLSGLVVVALLLASLVVGLVATVLLSSLIVVGGGVAFLTGLVVGIVGVTTLLSGAIVGGSASSGRGGGGGGRGEDVVGRGLAVVGDGEVDGVVKRAMLSDGDEDGLMVGCGVDRRKLIGTSRETIGNGRSKLTVLSSIVKTLEECENFGVGRRGLLEAGHLFDYNVRMAFDYATAVGLLRSGEVVLLSINEVASLEIADGHGDGESCIGLDGVAVLRRDELRRGHVVGGGNDTHGRGIA